MNGVLVVALIIAGLAELVFSIVVIFLILGKQKSEEQREKEDQEQMQWLMDRHLYK